ncbi:MAG TPA: DUF423 domain-containing protein [Acinetobacter sp.]|jgi:uncharacterized membrane protein YgdD (TMEM256/DUF423 family)|nr:DUF423 domain-containing protein [Acinetobacter sp.]
MWIAISAINLALAVLFGAFGAHGLKSIATVEQLSWWNTATQYFFYHALGLLMLGILNKVAPTFAIKTPFLLLQVGIILFCGSLYLMSLNFPKILGAVTPIGGLFMIAGWLTLAWHAFKFSR